MYLTSKWYIHLDRLWVIIYINFGNNQWPFSLKEQLLPFWSGQNKKFSNKRLDLFIKYLFRPILCGFLLSWRHLLLSYTLWLLKYLFYVSEAVIERSSERYSLEINEKTSIQESVIDLSYALIAESLQTLGNKIP